MPKSAPERYLRQYAFESDGTRQQTQKTHACTHRSSSSPQPPVAAASEPGRTAIASPARTQQQQTCQNQRPNALRREATMPREKKLRSRRWPVGRMALTHRVQRRPDRPPPSRNVRRHPGTQMCQPRAGARRCTRASPVRRDRMWSLPISAAAAYIY